MAKRETITAAHAIAKKLESEGWSETEVGMILGMALGIFVEGLEGSHRELTPLLKAHLEVAQTSFDAMRAARERQPGNA